jgi:hypothetical protein
VEAQQAELLGSGDPFSLAELALEMTAGLVLQWSVGGRSLDERDVDSMIALSWRVFLNGAAPR